MKRLLTLTLALLMTIVLFGAGSVYAEEENPYVGLWEITGYQEDGAYTPIADSGRKAYMDFLANGVIYGVMVDESSASVAYMGYKVTGENTLSIYEGEDPLPAVYDPASGVITVTDTDSGLATFVERIQEDPLPDIHGMVDNSKEEQTYYGYIMTIGGQTIQVLEALPLIGMELEDIYLTLNPDGTGYLQFGAEEAGGEITWNETEIRAEETVLSYGRVGDHIVVDMGEGQGGIEFAPQGEMEVLMLLKESENDEAAVEGALDAQSLAGEWKLVKATAAGQTLTAEQLKAQGQDMSFTFSADGSASMTSKGSITDGMDWTLEGSTIKLSMYGYDLFDFTYDGQYLVLNVMAKMYFEKVVSVSADGLALEDGVWKYYRNGVVDTAFEGLAYGENIGWFYVKNGEIDFSFTGIAYGEDLGYWYVKDGALDPSFTGVANSQEFGLLYCENGFVSFTWNGTYIQDGVTYTVENSRAVPLV